MVDEMENNLQPLRQLTKMSTTSHQSISESSQLREAIAKQQTNFVNVSISPPTYLNNEQHPTATYLKKIEGLMQENALLRASLSAFTRSQSADSKFTDGSLGSAASADGLALRRQHKGEVDALNQTIGDLENKLERTKNKYKAQLKEEKEKIESRDSEAVELKVQLGEMRAILKERDKQLGEWKALANSLIINNASFDEFKQKMKNLSAVTSALPSPQPSPVQSVCSQSDNEMEDQTTSAQELFGLANLGLTCYAGAALQFIQAISVQLRGKLAVTGSLTEQDLRKVYGDLKMPRGTIYEQHDSNEAFLQFSEKYLNGQYSKIQIEQERRIKCRGCNTIRSQHEKEMILPLQCSHSDFQSCLREYLIKYPMTGNNMVECDNCKRKEEADTWLNIDSTNEILLIQLNRFTREGICTTKWNKPISMPLKFVINNQQYELFVFVAHISSTAAQGHYIAYSNNDGTWTEYNDNKVTTHFDIDKIKDNGYYYGYRRVIKDYVAYVEQLAQSNIVEKECAYCHDIIVGPATYHIPSTGEVKIAGAMVDHLKHCNTIVSYSERIRIALQNHPKEHLLLNLSSQDVRTFFSQASRTLTLRHNQVCNDMRLVKKANKKIGAKILRAKAENSPTHQQLEEEKFELMKLKTELAALACTWTYKWDPVFVKMTPHIIVNGEVVWASYVPPAIQYITNGVCDKEGNIIYGTNTTEQNVRNSIYGVKRSAANRKLERQAKIITGTPLSLKELKTEEIDHICDLVIQNNDLFQQFQVWMVKYKVERDLNDPNLKKFEWVGPAFCDGIIVPKLPIFQSNEQYQAFLQKHGKLQIQKICDAANTDCLYVRLLDSANQLTEELIEGLNAINTELLTAMDKHLSAQLFPSAAIAEAMKDCNIRQVDYTRDMKGAFYSFDMKTDLNVLAKLLGMRKATHDEYTSIDSCFQFLKHHKGQPKELRMKFYNKIFHLIQSEQGKKKVSMNLKALINCSAAFFEKIDECIEEGLSRCEFSQYFDSADGLSQKLKFDDCASNLNNALEALNKVPSVYNTIPPIQFLDDYFETFASNLFIFEKHQWAVVYGKNRLSSYMGIIGNPCKMGKADFIAMYTHSKIINIIDNTGDGDLPRNTLVQAIREGPRIMQIPMQSLGVIHKIKNMFELDETKLRLALSRQEMSQIRILDKEGNPFFKVVEKLTKKLKTCRILKRKTVPFSQAKPKPEKRRRLDNYEFYYAPTNTFHQEQELVETAQPKKREIKMIRNGAMGEEVTSLLTEKRVFIDGKKVRRLLMSGFPDCSYSSNDIGSSYVCNHCGDRLKRYMKTRLFRV